MSYTVAFNDQSTPGPSGPITAWAWDFGDGGTSVLESPVHAFSTSGNHSVGLTVTGSGSDGTSSITHVVDVINLDSLTASFFSTPSNLSVSFTDTSTPGLSGPITGWAWTFGDGGTSTSQNPSHTYAAGGTYTVGLTVTGTSPDGTSNVSNPVSVTSSPAPGGTPGIGLLDYGYLGSFGTHPNLYSMVIGSAFTSGDVTVLKTCTGRGLSYFAAPDVSPNYNTGVPYTQALANNWLLKDNLGNLLRNTGYNDYIGDIGSSGYQNAWITNVLAYLAARSGIDGVFIDDVLMDPKGLCGTYPAKYPSTASWSAAMVSWCSAIYTALNANGYYVAINAGAYKSGDPLFNDGTSTLNWWTSLGPHTDGLMNEYYDETSSTQLRRTTGTAWYQQWDGWQRVIGKAQTLGCDFIGLMKGGIDTAQMMYGKASFFMEWDGGNSVFIYSTQSQNSTDPTNIAWTRDIGTPSASKQAVGVGWKRSYTRGMVVINPSPSTSQTFSLGASYHTPSGVSSSSITLSPTTAMILYT